MCILDVTIIDLTSFLEPVIVKSRKALGYKRLEPKGAYVLKPFLLEDNLARKRMFSLQVVDTDAFLEMPQTSQLLYFHLAMRADDDGFISNPKKIMKIIGSQDDDLKVLFSKRFIIGFDSGIIVIKHWKLHNCIANDRYHETTYLTEKSKLQIKDNGVYTECIQDVNSDKIRLDKDRLDKVSNKKIKSELKVEIHKYIIDGFYQYHNKKYNFDGKETKTAERLATLLSKDVNWEATLKAKINGLQKKVKENPKFWAFTIPKLEYGWNELPNIITDEDTSFIDELDMRNKK